MKKVIIPVLLILILISIVSVSSAVPKIEPYVNDFAHLLTPEQINALNVQCDEIEQNTSYEVAIVTVQNTEGEDRVIYANKIGDENGVGKKGKDNGIVVLWSVEDGGAIATGRYAESILNDAKVARIGRDARPLFDEGKYYEAFSQIITQIKTELNSSADGSVAPGTSSTGDLDFGHLIILGLIVLVFFWILSKLFDMDLGSAVAGAVVGSTIGRSRSGGSSSSGGRVGGGSFGGGSFGGGGGKF